MTAHRFRDRDDAARQVAVELKKRDLHDPVVLGIPRGGVVTAATIARELDGEMDIALSGKLRHPMQSELAIGAVSEDGSMYLEDRFRGSDLDEGYLAQERRKRLDELEERRKMFRDIRPAAELSGRSRGASRRFRRRKRSWRR